MHPPTHPSQSVKHAPAHTPITVSHLHENKGLSESRVYLDVRLASGQRHFLGLVPQPWSVHKHNTFTVSLLQDADHSLWSLAETISINRMMKMLTG